jgi:hypothetical protein
MLTSWWWSMAVNYNPYVTQDSLEFLLDPASEKTFNKVNLLPYSQDFSQSVYWKTQDTGTLTINSSTQNSPINDRTATLFTVNPVGTDFGLYQDIDLNGGNRVKFSFYYKKGTYENLDIFGAHLSLSITRYLGGNGLGNTSVGINIVTNQTTSFNTSLVFDARVSPVGDGWYRVVAYFQAGNPLDSKTRLMIKFNQGAAGTISFWGAQISYNWASEEYAATALNQEIPQQLFGKIKNAVDPSVTFFPFGFCSNAKNDGVSIYETYATAITHQSYIRLDQDIVCNDLQNYSFNFWVKLRSNALATFNSLCGNLQTSQWLSVFLTNSSGAEWDVRYRDATGVYRNFTSITDINIKNTWTNICVTVDSSRNVSLYVNGEFKQTLSAANTQFVVRALSGGYASGSNYYAFQGSLGMASVYKKTLSAQEVRQNFFANKGRFGL